MKKSLLMLISLVGISSAPSCFRNADDHEIQIAAAVENATPINESKLECHMLSGEKVYLENTTVLLSGKLEVIDPANEAHQLKSGKTYFIFEHTRRNGYHKYVRADKLMNCDSYLQLTKLDQMDGNLAENLYLIMEHISNGLNTPFLNEGGNVLFRSNANCNLENFEYIVRLIRSMVEDIKPDVVITENATTDKGSIGFKYDSATKQLTLVFY